MYEVVSTVEQEAIFNAIWVEAWEEKGYELEYSNDKIAQLLLKSDQQYVATIEFKQLETSGLCDTFDFKSLPYLAREFKHVVEIDKISIAKEHRGFEVLKVVISTLAQYAEDYSIPYYVGLVEPRFYLALRKYFKIDLKKLGPAFHYKGDTVIPMSLDTTTFLNNKEQFPWVFEKV